MADGQNVHLQTEFAFVCCHDSELIQELFYTRKTAHPELHPSP